MSEAGERPAPWLVGMNPEQLRAVSTTEGPLLILAGAGSGKTRVLTRRVAHLLSLGVEPDQILCVTFTKKAAAEMKERVVELVGGQGEDVWMSTFHAACCRILRADITPLGWTTRFAIYDDDDQLRLIKQCVADLNLDPKVVDPKSLLSRIDWFKTRLLGVEDALRQHRAHEQEPLIKVWEAYEASLHASDALDFNDLIGVTVRLFREHADVRERWQARFRYVMVDEYQDTNRAQYDLLTQLASSHRNLAVVGDDDQSIYGFRGADISIIRGFEHDYPEATVVRLEQNYRCTRHILSLANAVIAADTQRIGKKLWTDAEQGTPVQAVLSQSPEQEALRVANQCLELRRKGVSYNDIAIIYRTNRIAKRFQTSLAQAGVPHRIVGGRTFWERREVRDLLAYLRLVVNPADDAAFLRVVNVPTRGVGAKTLSKLREEAALLGQPLLRTARSQSTGRGAAGLASFIAALDALAEDARHHGPSEMVKLAATGSGYRDMLLEEVGPDGETSREAQERIKGLEELARLAKGYVPPPEQHAPLDWLVGWLDQVTLSGAHQEQAPLASGAVTLMTVHNAKGLEFDVVFVVQLMEGVFPHGRALEDSGPAEERRLAYVAFTRARKRLVLSRSANREPSHNPKATGKAREADGKAASPSRFLFGLPDGILVGDVPELPVDAHAPIQSGTEALRKPKKRKPAKSPAAATAATAADRPSTGSPVTTRRAGGRGPIIVEATALSVGQRVWLRDQIGVIAAVYSESVKVTLPRGPERIALNKGLIHQVLE